MVFQTPENSPKLVDALPDSDRGAEDDFIVVTGNWEFANGEPRDLSVPREEGDPSQSLQNFSAFSISQINLLQF